MSAEFKTPQEQFWAGEFGRDYIQRNQGATLLAANLDLFARILRHAGKIASCIEFGANIGMNLKALKLLHPEIDMAAVEINAEAAAHLAGDIGRDRVFQGSILDYPVTKTADLAFAKGVLIHMHPDHLGDVYDKLFAASHRYVMVCEYYNPSPVAIAYRGHSDRLFKRDFAGEMLDRFPSLRLIDYGFVYRRDPAFPQDDVTWFLMEKQS